MRLRILVTPMLHGSRQLRVQLWSTKHAHWNTLGKLQCPSGDWGQMVELLKSGAIVEGIECSVVHPHQERAA